MNLREFLEQHDRAKQLLLEGERSPWLDRHVATCEVCGPLAERLAEIDRAIEDVPEPRAELLRRLLRARRGDGPQAAAGRIEVLWPAEAAPGQPRRNATLAPLVLTVEADRYPAETPLPRHVERFVVVARHPVVLGRAPDMDVPLWDRSASRRHAELGWRGDGWVLRDLESTNGTRVNGTRVGNVQVPLRPGDRIEIGHHARLTVRTLLPAVDPLGISREIRRLLGATAGPAPRGDELRALREETVQLRDELRGADAESLPMVYERLSNVLAVIEQELLA
jgi:FHA domain